MIVQSGCTLRATAMLPLTFAAMSGVKPVIGSWYSIKSNTAVAAGGGAALSIDVGRLRIC
jgi:hypothetical protein